MCDRMQQTCPAIAVLATQQWGALHNYYLGVDCRLLADAPPNKSITARRGRHAYFRRDRG